MIFLDNASTTKVHDFIIDKMSDTNNEYYYNPSALYSEGLRVNRLLSEYRDSMKKCLSADAFDNIIFTGSATEANNLALRGVVKKNNSKVLVSMGEHPSVYNVAQDMKNMGYNVEFLSLNQDGVVDIDDFYAKMTKDTALVSIMHVSNETGAINDIKKLVSYAKSVNPKVVFHCDGVQAFGKIKVNVQALGVDMYTISAHKIYGMKGVGALYVKNGINLKPIVFGGGQEFGIRSGTENILGIMSLVEASSYAVVHLKEYMTQMAMLKETLISELDRLGVEYVLISKNNCSNHIVSISFNGIRAETLLHKLNEYGVIIGNGSACSSKKSGNRILSSMGIDAHTIESSVRISFGIHNTVEEVKEVAKYIDICTKDYKEKVKM